MEFGEITLREQLTKCLKSHHETWEDIIDIAMSYIGKESTDIGPMLTWLTQHGIVRVLNSTDTEGATDTEGPTDTEGAFVPSLSLLSWGETGIALNGQDVETALDTPFRDTYDCKHPYAVVAWTEARIYWSWRWEGSICISSLPRHPIPDFAPSVIGA